MQIFNIGKVQVVPLTNGSESIVSTVVVQVSGITADSGSMTPQLRISMEGQTTTPPPWGNCWYKNLWTGAIVAAGTAISADGEYEFQTDGSFLAMNVTAVTNGWQCFVTPLEGPSGMSSGSGGGGSSAVTAVAGAFADGAITTIGTEADAAVTNPALSATEIAALKGILTVLQAAPTAPTPVDGWVAAGSAVTGENPVLIGGSDGTNVQNLPLVDLNATPTLSTQLGIPTYSVLAAQSSGTVSSPLYTVHEVNSDGISMTNGLAIGAWVFDPTAGAWDRCSGPTGDNQSPTGLIGTNELLFNGTPGKYDRRRNNNDVVGLASAARTATTATPDQISYNFQGVIIVISVTALTATGTLTATLQGKDGISGSYYTLLAQTTPISTTGVYIMQFYPGVTAATGSNCAAPGRLPRTFNVNVVAGNSVSITYSVGLSMLS